MQDNLRSDSSRPRGGSSSVWLQGLTFASVLGFGGSAMFRRKSKTPSKDSHPVLWRAGANASSPAFGAGGLINCSEASHGLATGKMVYEGTSREEWPVQVLGPAGETKGLAPEASRLQRLIFGLVMVNLHMWVAGHLVTDVAGTLMAVIGLPLL